MLAVVAFGTWAVQDGRLTIGGLLAFLAYLAQLLRPVGDLSQLAASLLAASAGGERVLELLDRRPLVRERPGAVTLERVRGSVELDAVTFGYPDAPEPVLRGLSLSVAPGEVVALTGPSGCGKSTLARLLLRFADPQAGHVCLDGYDLRALTLASVRGNVAALLQETLLFDAQRARQHRVRASRRERRRDRGRRRGPRARTSSSPPCPRATTRASGSGAGACPEVSAAASRSPARSCATPRSSCSTSPPQGSTQRRRSVSSLPCAHLLRGRSALLITHDAQLLRCADRVRATRERPRRGRRRGPRLSRRAPRRPGSELAPGYELLAHLNRSRTLDVYDCWSAERECRCVVKALRPDRLRDLGARRRLVAEGRLLERLCHPGIVRGYETLARTRAARGDGDADGRDARAPRGPTPAPALGARAGDPRAAADRARSATCTGGDTCIST